MAHPLECPSCHFTTRVSEELFARKVAGRRVKIPCKGCRESMVVDATTSELHVLPYLPTRREATDEEAASPLPRAPRTAPSPRHPGERGASHASSWVPGPAPTARARALDEEELPTLRQNEIPVDESFLSPIVVSDPPPTTWPQTIPPLGDSESLSALLAPAPRRARGRVALLALLVVGFGSVGAWAARKHPVVSELVAQVVAEERGSREDGASPAGQASMAPMGNSPASRTEPAPLVAEIGSVAHDALDAGDASSGEPSSGEPSPGNPAALRGDTPAKNAERPSPPASLPSATGEAAPVNDARPLTPAEPSGPAETVERPAELPAFDKGAAAAALQVAESQAAACRNAGDPTGMARVVVTFAPSGRVTTATVSGAPFAGTPTGGCIAGRFRSAQVPPFDGSYVTVTKTVLVQ